MIFVLDEKEDVLFGVDVTMLEEVDLLLPNQVFEFFKCTLDVFLLEFFLLNFFELFLWGGQNMLFLTVLFESLPNVLEGSGYGLQSPQRGFFVGIP